ncbi:hypothetical protein H3146_05995 [Streptomyces sp. OF3]|uniref:Uncharacterized protein n=1 Tax=Streptomyces alkaliterrae TaxID=2213162 RepID=A0A7W3WID5_9ACTN|nr:hypothetical protein [Streptomyces alkaliterrae]MBB1252919.1 hypothetical protein [Streptomyces alkaliterrae]
MSEPMQWTAEERAEIAAENDRIAACLWPQVEAAEKAGNVDLACRLRNFACDAEDVASAARVSSARLARIY